jgi:hypothetical protein
MPKDITKMYKKNSYLQHYYIFIVISFSISSSFYLTGDLGSVSLFNELYYLKHASISILGVVGILSFVLKQKNTVGIIIILIIPYSAYLGIMNGIVFLQFCVFLVSVSFLSKTYTKYFFSKKYLFIFMIAILLVPAFDIILNNGDYIYNSVYGRKRLLLGYFHPKEAGIMILALFILVVLSDIIRIRFILGIFHLMAITILYLIQSRNALLFYVDFLVINSLLIIFGLKQTLIIIGVTSLSIVLLALEFNFKELDLLMSGRLSSWIASYDFNLFGQILQISKGFEEESFRNKFHIDNFYLEFLIEAGGFAFVLLLFLLCYFGFKIRNSKINSYYVLSIYIAFLVYCFFDAGMFSTGNYLNVFVWSIVVFALKNTKILQETYRREHHTT